jgi:hypothetical protein
MLRQQHYLPHMVREVSKVAIERLANRMWVSANVNSSLQIIGRQFFYHCGKEIPCCDPLIQQVFARIVWVKHELAVTVTVGLFTIGGQKWVHRERRFPLICFIMIAMLWFSTSSIFAKSSSPTGAIARSAVLRMLTHVGQILVAKIRHCPTSRRRDIDVCAST